MITTKKLLREIDLLRNKLLEEDRDRRIFYTYDYTKPYLKGNPAKKALSLVSISDILYLDSLVKILKQSEPYFNEEVKHYKFIEACEKRELEKFVNNLK